MQIIQFSSKFSKYFWSKKSFLVSNWNVGWFELSFDVDIVYVNQKIVNILHFCSKSLKIFSVEMGLLWLDLMKILWNIGWISKLIMVDKDASFHLRPVLVKFDNFWGWKDNIGAMCHFDPPHFIDRHKSPPWLGLKAFKVLVNNPPMLNRAK